MKKLTIFIAALLFQAVAMAQWFDKTITEIEPTELIVRYMLSYVDDSLAPENVKQTEMILFRGGSTSKFISKSRYTFDTIMKKISSHEQMQAILMDPSQPIKAGRFDYRIFKNYPKGRITYLDHILLGGSFRYEEPLNLIDWQIGQQTDTLVGYPVQEATCTLGGREWTAWFTPAIPYSDGPYKFHGLPGLILKVYDARKQFVFEFLSANIPAEPTMIELVERDYITTTREKFMKASAASRNNITSRMSETGVDMETQQKAARIMDRRNNPIELK
jgi:GLPGLI family protein